MTSFLSSPGAAGGLLASICVVSVYVFRRNLGSGKNSALTETEIKDPKTESLEDYLETESVELENWGYSDWSLEI